MLLLLVYFSATAQQKNETHATVQYTGIADSVQRLYTNNAFACTKKKGDTPIVPTSGVVSAMALRKSAVHKSHGTGGWIVKQPKSKLERATSTRYGNGRIWFGWTVLLRFYPDLPFCQWPVCCVRNWCNNIESVHRTNEACRIGLVSSQCRKISNISNLRIHISVTLHRKLRYFNNPKYRTMVRYRIIFKVVIFSNKFHANHYYTTCTHKFSTNYLALVRCHINAICLLVCDSFSRNRFDGPAFVQSVLDLSAYILCTVYWIAKVRLWALKSSSSMRYANRSDFVETLEHVAIHKRNASESIRIIYQSHHTHEYIFIHNNMLTDNIYVYIRIRYRARACVQ